MIWALGNLTNQKRILGPFFSLHCFVFARSNLVGHFNHYFRAVTVRVETRLIGSVESSSSWAQEPFEYDLKVLPPCEVLDDLGWFISCCTVQNSTVSDGLESVPRLEMVDKCTRDRSLRSLIGLMLFYGVECRMTSFASIPRDQRVFQNFYEGEARHVCTRTSPAQFASDFIHAVSCAWPLMIVIHA